MSFFDFFERYVMRNKLCAAAVTFLQAILNHSEVAEAAVVGLPDELKGHIPIGLCVLKSGQYDY